MDDLALLARLLLAAVFLVSGVAKVVDPASTRAAVEGFKVPAGLVVVVSWTLPAVELVTAGLLLTGSLAELGLAVAALLLVAFTIVVALTLRRGDAVDCNCFGALTPSAAVSGKTVLRNVALLGLVGAAAASGTARQLSVLSWLQRHDGSALALGAVLTLLSAAVAGLALACHALLRQQGRMLLRLDALEAGAVHHHTPVVAPGFSLQDADGLTRTLDSLLDTRPLLLVFTTPTCAPCAELLPELSLWHQGLSDVLRIAVVTRGDAQAGKAKLQGTGLTVLLDPDAAVSLAYEGMTTPTGVLVDPDGTIVGGPGAGAAAIRQLAESVSGDRWAEVQPLHLRAPRSGEPLQAELSVVDPSGDAHRLADLLEAPRTLIMMWSPTCSFAQQVSSAFDDVIEHAGELGVDVLVVNHGPLTELADLQFAGRVRQFASLDGAVGHQLGVPGTPVGVLVGRDGRLLRRIAEGSGEVAELLGELQTSVEPLG